jgi:CHAT domain-containing protein/Tfp pilus assembly protein PilF
VWAAFRTAVFAGAVAAAAPSAIADTLQQGLAAQLQPAQSLRYEQALAAGEFLRVVVEQLGADVEVHILDPSGAQVWYCDSRASGSEVETAFWVAQSAGVHTVVVTHKGKAAGGIRISEVDRRPASDEDRALARAEGLLRLAELKRRDRSAGALAECVEAAQAARALLPAHPRRMAALAFIGLCNRDINRLDLARPAFEEALATARQLGHAPSEAENLVYLGNLHSRKGEFREALGLQQQAVVVYGRIGRKSGEGFAWNNIASLQSQLGQNERAAESYEKAIACFREARDRGGESLARLNLGVTLQLTGRADAALASLEEALRGLREANDRVSAASALNTMAAVFGDLGDRPRAHTYAEQALALRRELGDRHAQARSHAMIGNLLLDDGSLAEAHTHLTTALELYRETKDKDGQAWTLYLLGRVRLQQRARGAEDLWQEALSLRRQTGAVQEEAWLLAAMAEARIDGAHTATARGLLDESLAKFQAAGDPHGEAHALYLLARLERAEGDRPAALKRAAAALDVAESVRSRVASSELRATYLAKVRRYYELMLELLLEKGAGPPGAAAVEQAFAISERARARALLDLFAISAAELDAGLDPELRRRRDALQDEIASRQSDLVRTASSGERDAAARREASSSLERAYEAYDLLADEIRRRHPRYASIVYPEPAQAAHARGLVDADTVLLEYFAGESASYLFLVDEAGVGCYRLPAVATLQRSIDDVRAGVEKPSRLALPRLARGARALYRALLLPVETRLKGRRHLLVAPDGPLYRIPFETLLTAPPGAPLQPTRLPYLVRRFSVRYVPSVAVMQRLASSRATGELDLFAVGDPDLEGPSGGVAPSSIRRSLFGDTPLQSLPRLPGARSEVQAIARLFPAARVRVLLGAEATEENVRGSGLGSARYLHFATHALVSERRPAQSGLVLAAGAAQPDAFLQAHEVLGLELQADLVTLSACSTGLGREVLGEGLLGLTQAFFVAGARGVVATLWPVTDTSSSDLMVRFYAALARGEADAVALQAAKREMLTGRWAHPHHWASYVVIGR